MSEEIQQLLRNLRLRKMAEMIEGELAAARKTSPSYTDLLARLLRAEWRDQQERRLQARIKHAHLPEQWTLEPFPFKQQPGVSRRQICELAELEFIPKAVNVVFIGPTGMGKTGLASGLLLKALQNGYRGLFIRAQDLFDEMYASLADRASRKLIRRWARLDILLIDEVGYLNLRPEQTNILFKLMEERYRRKAMLITTNLEYDQWARLLGNKDLTKDIAVLWTASSESLTQLCSLTNLWSLTSRSVAPLQNLVESCSPPHVCATSVHRPIKAWQPIPHSHPIFREGCFSF